MNLSLAIGGSIPLILVCLISLSSTRLTSPNFYLTRLSRHRSVAANLLPELRVEPSYPEPAEPSFDDDFRLDDEDPMDDVVAEAEFAMLPHRRNATHTVSRGRRAPRRCGKELLLYVNKVCANCVKGSKLPKMLESDDDDMGDMDLRRRKRSPGVFSLSLFLFLSLSFSLSLSCSLSLSLSLSL